MLAPLDSVLARFFVTEQEQEQEQEQQEQESRILGVRMPLKYNSI